MAIDEIKVYNGSCPEIRNEFINCDFENENCGFIPEDNKDVIWKRYMTNDVSEQYIYDASNYYNGHFVALDFGLVKNVIGKSLLYSPIMEPTETTCVSFAYYLKTDSSNTKLNIYASQANYFELIQSYSQNSYAEKWYKVYLEVQQEQKWNLVFEGEYNGTSSGILAVDDVTIYNGACKQYTRCDFEERCEWESVYGRGVSKQVNAFWKRMRGDDLYPKITDHTLNRVQGYVLALVNHEKRKSQNIKLNAMY
ncbi:MAM and LDL-receptor class A domain-containing protein 1-like protein, partial [Leptotrombidium deliense]